VKAFRALVAWLDRARSQGSLGDCDVRTFASTTLAALHGWALTGRLCGVSTAPADERRYVEGFIEHLWKGVGSKP
jgi:hypothetical protein